MMRKAGCAALSRPTVLVDPDYVNEMFRVVGADPELQPNIAKG